jgi:chromosome segregation ATPase
MPEHATSTGSERGTGSAESAQLREELNRSREEVLRLRDRLISQDAELGSLKGQVAALEAGTARLLNVVTKLRSLFPGFLWRAATGLLRRLGSRG